MTRRRRANELANDPSPFGSAKPSSFGGNYRGVLFPSIDDRVFCLITQYKTGNYLTASCCHERGHQLPSKFFPFHAILSTQIFRQFEIVKRVLPSSSNCGIKKRNQDVASEHTHRLHSLFTLVIRKLSQSPFWRRNPENFGASDRNGATARQTTVTAQNRGEFYPEFGLISILSGRYFSSIDVIKMGEGKKSMQRRVKYSKLRSLRCNFPSSSSPSSSYDPAIIWEPPLASLSPDPISPILMTGRERILYPG